MKHDCAISEMITAVLDAIQISNEGRIIFDNREPQKAVRRFGHLVRRRVDTAINRTSEHHRGFIVTQLQILQHHSRLEVARYPSSHQAATCR